MSKNPKHFYEFGAFRLDVQEQQLRCGGEVIPLTPKAYEVLLLLVENSGHLLGKDKFLQKIWGGSFVEENNLADNISTLRKALGDDRRRPSFIETIPRRGYRFIGEVTELREEDVEIVLAERAAARLVIEEDVECATIAPPAEREAIQERALAKIPRAGESSRLWRRPVVILAAACLAVVAVGSATHFFRVKRAEHAREPHPVVNSIAVLPFRPLVADGQNEYLELGLADALITKLSNIKEISVRPTSAILKYREHSLAPLDIGRDQQVDGLLEGQFQKVDDRIRLSVQLVRVSDGRLLWAETFDDSFTNIFSVQDSVSTQIARALELKLTGEERRRLIKRYTDNAEAYELYLKGRYNFSKWTREGINKAIEYYQQSVEKDPGYAQPLAGLANCYHILGVHYLPPNEVFPKAKEYALKALEIDDTLCEAHAALGLAKSRDWDWLGAEKKLRRAIELNPNYAEGHEIYAHILLALGRMDDAIKEMKLAREIDPLSPSIIGGLGNVLYTARRYDEAIEQYRTVLELYPNRVEVHTGLALAYAQKLLYEEALAEMKKAVTLSGESEKTSPGLAFVYALAGKRAEAQMIVSNLEELSKNSYRPPLPVAWVYAGLGEKDKTFEWLEKAYRERSASLVRVVSPDYDKIRSDDRYGDLLRRIGLSL